MTLSKQQMLILLAAGGSAALMLGALGFQHIGGMAPCKMCLWQRYPHVIAIGIGLIAFWIPGRILPLLGALAALTTAVIGVYHTGVERDWWEGPTSCTSSSTSGLSTQDLMDQIMNAPLIRCDEVPWEMFTLSMASWNALASFAIFGLWLLAVRAR
jgi:disulfide bond formation protein DsbB